MKTKRLFLFGYLATTTLSALSQSVLINHFGYTDPSTEGFSLNLSPGGSVGPVTNDFGKNSWQTVSGGAPTSYGTTLTVQQQQQLADVGWSLSATLRVVQFSAYTNNFTSLGIFMLTDSGEFGMNFGTTTDGNPFVRVHSSLTPVYILNGGVSDYHTYDLKYDASSAFAALWVDGVERVSDITARASFGSVLYWGAFQGSTVQANWNEVILQAIPEPCTLALFGLGGLVLAASRLHRQRLRS